MIVETPVTVIRDLGVEGLDRLEVDTSTPYCVVLPIDKNGDPFSGVESWAPHEIGNLIEALEKALELMGGAPAPKSLPSSKEAELREIATGWVESPAPRRHAHGRIVLDILDA